MSEDEAEKTLGTDGTDQNLQEDDERLKGDAIGDTLYSESWVLKTLVNLTQVRMTLISKGKLASNLARISRNYPNILANLKVKMRIKF